MTHKEIVAEIARLTDLELLDVLTNGQETMSPTGEVVRVRPSPQYMGQIIKRLKDLGVTAMRGTGSATDRLVERAEEVMKFKGQPVDPKRIGRDPEAEAV